MHEFWNPVLMQTNTPELPLEVVASAHMVLSTSLNKPQELAAEKTMNALLQSKKPVLLKKEFIYKMSKNLKIRDPRKLFSLYYHALKKAFTKNVNGKTVVNYGGRFLDSFKAFTGLETEAVDLTGLAIDFEGHNPTVEKALTQAEKTYQKAMRLYKQLGVLKVKPK